MFLKAFVLCAGRGTRFSPYSKYTPKVLIPFLNLPLVVYNLYLLKTLGVTYWAANIHQHIDLLKDQLSYQAQLLGMMVPVLSYESRLLGSAGALIKLRSFFESEEHFFYLNGDSFIWPETKDSLMSFYSDHVKSGALASFLVKSTYKTKGVIWTNQAGQIVSFLKKPVGDNFIIPNDFSGLALFSSRIFTAAKFPREGHIFKDVLEGLSSKGYLRIHNVSNLKFLDMNHKQSYLENTQQALYALQNIKDTWISQTLDICLPFWNRFSGESYFSVDKIKNPPSSKADILFCGSEIKNLEKLLVKNFAVLGNNSVFTSSVCMNSSVLGEKAILNKNLNNDLYLK